MKRMRHQVVAFGCVVALVVNCLPVLAQNAQEEKAKVKDRVVVITADTVRTGDGPVFDVLVGPDVVQGQQIPGRKGEFEFIVDGNAETFSYFSAEMSFDVHAVKGKPFSAAAVNETTQTLSDGNRIVRRTSSSLYRDSEGRTRREQSLGSVGSWTPAGDAPQRVFINDPVSGVNFVLDARAQTAQKMRLMPPPPPPPPPPVVVTASAMKEKVEKEMKKKLDDAGLQGKALKKVQPPYPPIAKAAGAQGTVGVVITVDETGQVVTAEAVDGHPLLRESAVVAARQWQFQPTEIGGQAVKVKGTLSFNFTLAKGSNANAGEQSFQRVAFAEKHDVRKEALGKQMFDGVEAEGTRTITTIAAGAIGNERPIEIVYERWYSPELQLVVLTRHSDPRSGESVYRLENINRTEPSADLFRVPSDYTVKESMQLPAKMRTPKFEEK